MRAWAILWNVDNVDKTGRSEKMVEWWVIYLWCFSFLLWCWRSMSKMFFFYYYYFYCLVFLSVRLILSLICIKQTVIHPAFPETRDSLIPQKSIFNILSIIRTLANTISIQSLKTPKNIRTHADTVPGPREEIFPNRRTTKYIAIHKTTNNETTLNK